MRLIFFSLIVGLLVVSVTQLNGAENRSAEEMGRRERLAGIKASLDRVDEDLDKLSKRVQEVMILAGLVPAAFVDQKDGK